MKYNKMYILVVLLIQCISISAQSPDMATENIQFTSAGASLAGTIYQPQHSHAAVVLVHGSGQESRSGEFASFLAKHGISVLTYDKRGVGRSGGIYAGPEVGTNNIDSANLTLLAEDVSAAVNMLHLRDKNVPIGLVGFSQAGWIIPIAASKNLLVDFIVLFSGPVVPTLEQLRFQFFTEGKPDFWDSHTETEVREHINNDADRYQFANTDPYDALSKPSIPGLWLFGGQDIQIPVGLSIERLNTLKTQGKPYEYCLFSTLGHNVAFSGSTEPVDIAVYWIKDRKHFMKSKASNKKSEIGIHESVRLETDTIFDKLVQIRRDLHKHPELSGKEKRTQEVIKKYLSDLGLQVETGIYGYGIIGILEGEKKGKKVAWRADMDALPDDFPDHVEFKSMVKRVKHSCGHDVHMTIALGIAEVMTKNKNSLQGTVYFIFQPEEETFAGAKGMLENKLLTEFNIDEIYGLHVIPAPVGQVMVKPNEMYAYQRKIRIGLKNTLSEEEAKKLATKIRNSLVRTKDGSKPWELQSLVNPEIGLTNPNTIFKDYLIAGEYPGIYSKNDKLYIDIQLYETDSARFKDNIPVVKQVIDNQNYSSQLLSVLSVEGNPIVINDPKLTNASIHVLNNIYGREFIAACYGQVPYSNDDFAYFQQEIPGVYFFLGASNFEKRIIAMPHSPDFGVDEECIRIGVCAFSSLIFERLK